MRASRHTVPLKLRFLYLPLLVGSFEAQQTPSLQVDQTQYRATCLQGRGDSCRYAFTLVAQFRNITRDTFYIGRCMPRDPKPRYGIEYVTDSTQDAAYDRVWACVGGVAPIIVAPNATRTDTLEIEGPNAFDGKTHAPLGVLEGDFRLIYTAGLCGPGQHDCGAPSEEQRSQVFRVHLGSRRVSGR